MQKTALISMQYDQYKRRRWKDDTPRTHNKRHECNRPTPCSQQNQTPSSFSSSSSLNNNFKTNRTTTTITSSYAFLFKFVLRFNFIKSSLSQKLHKKQLYYLLLIFACLTSHTCSALIDTKDESSTTQFSSASSPFSESKKKEIIPEEQCYCQLSGKTIHDTNCLCDVENLIDYSDNVIYPLVKKLILTDFFRFYKVDTHRGCKYWQEDYICATNKCGIEPCLQDELPLALKSPTKKPATKVVKPQQQQQHSNGKSSSTSKETPDCETEQLKLSKVQGLNAKNGEENIFYASGNFLSQAEYSEMTSHWDKHDQQRKESQPNKYKQAYQLPFCLENDEDEEKMKYYDLLANPEGFTGYAGEPARKVWRKIYDENCYGRG